ncbi:MAG: aminopeptidase [Bacteroidota bacterium]
MELLKKLIEIPGPSGEEKQIKDFIYNYVTENKKHWKYQPEIIHGEEYQDCIMLKFGKPQLAIFAHMDTVGFHVKYGKELIKIGGPAIIQGTVLVGTDSKGPVECSLIVDEETKKLYYKFNRLIDPGTSLIFKPEFKEKKEYIESCFLDDRLGIWVLLKLAENLSDGLLIFTCWEEHGGGSVSYLAKTAYEKYNINKALIADITWVTEGVQKGKGVAISQRDKYIPRKSFFNKITEIAKSHNVDFQTEVEDAGGSDGSEIQRSPYPIDWCFIGAPELNNHSPNEIVYKSDIATMLKLYEILSLKL